MFLAAKIGNVTPPFSHFQPPDPKSKKATMTRLCCHRRPRSAGPPFSLPRRQRPRGRIFAVLLAPLVDDSTRTTGCTSRRAENVTTSRCYETLRALGRSQGGTEGGTRARTKPCDALDLGGVAAEQPTLEAMRASGRCWPRRGCSREISLPSGATRATAAACRHGPDNDRGPCSADLKPQMWSAPSQLPAIRCFCGDGFAAA